MADYVRLAVDAGAKIIGGCCGTSFEHLAAMRQALDAPHQAATARRSRRIVEQIGPLRNKTADKSGGTGETSEARRERRRAGASYVFRSAEIGFEIARWPSSTEMISSLVRFVLKKYDVSSS